VAENAVPDNSLPEAPPAAVPETTDEILTSVDSGVAVVTFHRPDRLNAITPTMATAYTTALRSLDQRADVRVIVVTGAGRAFCAGADLAELKKGVGHLDEHFASPAMAPDAALHLRKPVIAAINGPTAGLGFAYALATDIRFVAAGATMTTSFARLGLVAEYGLAWLLPRVVGLSRATELLMSSRTIDADEAVRIGLAHAVTTGPVLDEAVAYAHELIANCSPASWAVLKGQLLRAGGSDFSEAMTSAYGLMRESFRGPDVAEALAAREQRRPPQFHDLPPTAPVRT
jgi:enoyl-CoA hydratase/carnithine racemase